MYIFCIILFFKNNYEKNIIIILKCIIDGFEKKNSYCFIFLYIFFFSFKSGRYIFGVCKNG